MVGGGGLTRDSMISEGRGIKILDKCITYVFGHTVICFNYFQIRGVQIILPVCVSTGSGKLYPPFGCFTGSLVGSISELSNLSNYQIWQ